MSMETYTPGSTFILHSVSVDMKTREIPRPVHLVQYDHKRPILAVSMYNGGVSYRVPVVIDAYIRAKKPDGTVVYNPALGLDSTRTILYFSATSQMTACAGDVYATIELTYSGNVAGSAPLRLVVDRNPVQEEDMESASEIITQLNINSTEIIIDDTQPEETDVLWFDTSEA